MTATVVGWEGGGCPEVRPLCTVADLLAWTPASDDCLCAAIVPLPVADGRRLHRGCAAVLTTAVIMPSLLQRRDGGLDADRPRLLACHDMRGGYLEDRMVQGGGDADAYLFRHWHAIDGFVYFSHRLVTVPPPGWVNAAHTHGVQVLGTLITEWEAGEAACAEMFGSQEAAERVAGQLAAMAAHLGFDGWVINIENAVDAVNVRHLFHFLCCLTAAMHAAVPGSKVIWYDAVTVEGRLDWQNALNVLNAPFFDATDGVWINYTWKPEALAETRAAAGKRPFDVYAGVDCFGRGTYGGGGLQCNQALAAAREAGLSAALFAVGWPFEMHNTGVHANGVGSHAASADPAPTAEPHYPWQTHNEEFWRLIMETWLVQRATLCALPAWSDFSAGAGRALLHDGALLRPAAWYNLSLQSLQPVLAFKGGAPEGLVARVTDEVAFSGGTCVSLAGVLASPVVLRLFRAAAEVPPSGLRVSFTAAASKGVTLRLCLRLRRADGEGSFALEVGPPSAASMGGSAPLQGGRAAFRPGSRLREVPLSLSAAVPAAAGPNTSPSKASLGAGGRPTHWVSWQCSIGPAELPEWALHASVVSSVEVVAGPAVPGASCQCTCFIGAVNIAPLHAGAAGESKAVHAAVGALVATRVQLHSGVAVGGARVGTLSALLRWEMPQGCRRCQVWVKFAEAPPQVPTAPGAPPSPSKLTWGMPQWLGAACAPAYAVAQLALPQGAVAARFFVAVGGGGLRQATAVTVVVQGQENGDHDVASLPV